jgi:hypothetical protein
MVFGSLTGTGVAARCLPVVMDVETTCPFCPAGPGLVPRKLAAEHLSQETLEELAEARPLEAPR